MPYRFFGLMSLTACMMGCAAAPPPPFKIIQERTQRQAGLTVDRPPRLRGLAHVPNELIAEPLTVDSAVRIALLYNRDLAVAYDALDISQAELTQAGLLKNPVLDLSVRLPDRQPRKTYLDFGVSDSLVDLLLIGARKRLAETAFTQSQAGATHQVLQTVAEVRSAYIAAVASEQALQLTHTLVSAAAAADLAANQLRQAGNVPETQPLQTHVAQLRTQRRLIDAQMHVDQTRATLAKMLALGPDQTQWRLSDHLPDVPGAESTGPWETLALTQRQDLAAARAGVELAARRLGVTTDTRFWRDATAGAEAEHETDGQWRIGPTINLPIPLFDQGQASIARAKAELQSAIDTYQALRLEVLAQVRSTQAELSAARSMALLDRDEMLPTQQRLIDQTQLRFNGMYDSVFVLLEARQTQVEDALQYVESLRAYWTASAALDAAVGGRIPTAAAPPASLPTTQPQQPLPMDSKDMENMDMHLQH